MIILGIETSCDETALSIIESGNGTDIAVLADKTLSQIELHKQYGGVFPNMAKREHAKNLLPLLETVLREGGFLKLKVEKPVPGGGDVKSKVEELTMLLEREPELLEQFLKFIPTIERPPLDAIAVTEGPGLEPCLWTGINLAKALSLVWNVPVIPVNHMEGHIFSSLLRRKENPKHEIPACQSAGRRNPKQIQNLKSQALSKLPTCYQLQTTSFPSLSLLISGGHTELVLIKGLLDYEIIGQTRDDAVGEAFDKVARLLGLPYPGGPEISRLAEQRRESKVESQKSKVEAILLPRPMIHSGDFDFSFSGIKTSVLYLIKKLPELTDALKKEIALEFENAITEVLIAKTRKALDQYGAQALLIGGGVIANTHIRRAFEDLANPDGRRDLLSGFTLHIPEKELTTDNALMIAVSGLLRMHIPTEKKPPLRAQGNLRLSA